MTNKEKLQRAFLVLNEEIKSNTEKIDTLELKLTKAQNQIKYLKQIVKTASMISPN